MKDPYLEQDELIARELFHYWQADWNGTPGYWWQKHTSLQNEKMSASIGYPTTATRSNGLPRFSECIEATYVMEYELKSHYLQEPYIETLIEIVLPAKSNYEKTTMGDNNWLFLNLQSHQWFTLVHASPQQRAEACYRVLKEKGGI